MLRLIMILILTLPTASLAELWNCGGVYSSKPKDETCTLVKNSSTKCINNGFRKISVVKKGEEVVEENCARTDPEKKKKKVMSNRAAAPVSKALSEGMLDIDKFENEERLASLPIPMPVPVKRNLSERDFDENSDYSYRKSMKYEQEPYYDDSSE